LDGYAIITVFVLIIAIIIARKNARKERGVKDENLPM